MKRFLILFLLLIFFSFSLFCYSTTPIVEYVEVEVPVYIPVYVEKPIYKEVEKLVEVEVPVYQEFMSAEDFELLCQLIYYEAGSENTTDEDRVLVGNVALNRLDLNYRGAETLEEVIRSKGQYTVSNKISSNTNKSIPMSSILAAYKLACGERFCPENVIYQSQGKQGDGVWKKVGKHYYCYDNNYSQKEVQDENE